MYRTPTTPTHVLQMPRAREAVGVRDKVVEADPQHRTAFTDLQARLNKRLNVSIFINWPATYHALIYRFSIDRYEFMV